MSPEPGKQDEVRREFLTASRRPVVRCLKVSRESGVEHRITDARDEPAFLGDPCRRAAG